MANLITLPFNYDPVDNLEDSASYTVGSGGGDYAIVSVTLGVSAVGTSDADTTSGGHAFATSSSDSTTIQLHLKNGSVLTKTETAASSTTGSTTVGDVTSTSIAIIFVDGTAVGTISASASAGHSNGSSYTSTVSGISDVEWHIAEFTSIT